MQFSFNTSNIQTLLGNIPQAKVARVISVLLLVFLAYQAAQLTWLILAESSTRLPVVNVKPETNQSATQVSTRAISQLNLFGRYSEQKVAPKVEVQDAPQTTLRLTLSGTVASSDPAIAAAIIENNGKQEAYGIGDKITGTRATLESVATDRVLIKQSGRLETLMLDGFKYSKPSITSSPIDSRPVTLPENRGELIDQRENEVVREQAIQLKEDFAENPNSITDYLKILPKREDGEIIGYQLMPGENQEFFKSSGLQAGDIAVQMNGLDLTIPSEAAQALQALKNEQELSLLINRNGEMTEILFSIQ